MDWILWLIVIVAIVAVVWWLLNRNNARSVPGPDAVNGSAASTPAAAASVPANEAQPDTGRPEAEADAPETGETAAETETETAAERKADVPEESRVEPAAHEPIHHPEYTEPHAPTLPGAESAAAETLEEAETGPTAPQGAPTAAAGPAAAETPAGGEPRDAGKAPLAEAEILQTTQSSAAAESFASHTAEPVGHTAEPAGQPADQAAPQSDSAGQPADQAAPQAEPAGHLAAGQPYGEGSAAPAADGSGPDGFSVKGDASSMTYHDETSPAFEETRAEVWFLSPAHAEAAGFRPPRRTRR